MGLDIDFGFDVGQDETHRVEFHWGQMFGRVRITVDDQEVIQENKAVSLGSTKLRKFEFAVGAEEKHHVLIEKESHGSILGGARKQTCRAFVDGELVGEY